ncbi:MAG: hypothetical protein QNJ47_18485 [Nostocaceae cyanobacterium]|nr:hypothetical protein [Nostocaceae cyanobacterium]
METQITLNLPDEVYKKAEYFAKLTNRNIADVLTQAIALSLIPVSPHSIPLKSLENSSIRSLSDEEIIALIELQMEPEQDQRLRELLYNQQAGTLTTAEHSELLVLMQIYQENLLLKAQALREAVRRGLREPLES